MRTAKSLLLLMQPAVQFDSRNEYECSSDRVPQLMGRKKCMEKFLGKLSRFRQEKFLIDLGKTSLSSYELEF